ncbi:hypothetical protein L6452_37360 [Arctium lappa]|uniref:Uncharacterized protein n=1 Tax=Arctium lappa TaxID=4217 RepID=A0ACB8Y2S8_ARCLA|nr:hypothetical protein L6452_37360 [Arctium lappa]
MILAALQSEQINFEEKFVVLDYCGMIFLFSFRAFVYPIAFILLLISNFWLAVTMLLAENKRNDMVKCFSKQCSGFAFTAKGWA